ncbi:MAG: hypothetical protein M1814_005493 [Vezdaea aestivalis]|nr:MAG: hypothetical protein M1814_005493 [Vezdaea aestivalis]
MASNPSKPAAGADDTHRKTYDTAAYAAKSSAREASEKAESKARYEAKLAGKKYHKRITPPPDAHDSAARTARLDISSLVGKTSLVPAGASAGGKRGKSAGFYCDACDLTFKDNLQWVEHLNSKGHGARVGESGVVKRATLEDVKERLRWLKRKREEDEIVVGLDERVKMAGEREDKEKEDRRVARREKRKKPVKEALEVETGEGGDDEMAKVMGFGGFKTTKV